MFPLKKTELLVYLKKVPIFATRFVRINNVKDI